MSIVVTCRRRRLEMLGAVVERRGGQRVQHARPAGAPGCRRDAGRRRGPARRATVEPAGHAAAPADLDHVAERRRDGRLADQAGVEHLAVLPQPVQHLAGAVDRGAFLVAGDQQADRAGEVVAALGQEALGRGDEGGDRRPSCRPRRGRTARRRAPRAANGSTSSPRRRRRHHVGMAGEAEIGAGRCRRRA